MVTCIVELFLYFQCALRPVGVVAPDCARISEALLLSYGFTEAATLSSSLTRALDTFTCQVHTTVVYRLHSVFIG